MVDAILMDITQPSEALAWEVEQVTAKSCSSVFIAEASQLAEWAKLAENGQSTSPAAQVLSDRLRGQHVLVYSNESASVGKEFRRSLGRAVRYGAPARVEVSAAPWKYRVRATASAAAYYAGVATLAVSAGAWLYFQTWEWVVKAIYVENSTTRL